MQLFGIGTLMRTIGNLTKEQKIDGLCSTPRKIDERIQDVRPPVNADIAYRVPVLG